MTNQDWPATDIRRQIVEHFGVGTPFLCSLATVGPTGEPWVRFVRAKMDSELVLRIPTFEATSKIAHIEAEPRVHVTCGDTTADTPGSYFQIEGTAEISRERDDRQACWTDLLAKWFADPMDPRYAVVKVRSERITVLPIGRQGPAQRWVRDEEPL